MNNLECLIFSNMKICLSLVAVPRSLTLTLIAIDASDYYM